MYSSMRLHFTNSKILLRILVQDYLKLSWPAILLGVWLLVMLWPAPGFGQGPGNGWLYAKLFIVVLAIVYQEICANRLRRFKAGTERHGHVWFRWFNEIPVLLLLATVILVVVKPF